MYNNEIFIRSKFVSSTLEQKEIAISPTTTKPTHSFGVNNFFLQNV